MCASAISTDELAGVCGAALNVLTRAILICDHDTILFANTAAASLLRAESANDLLGLALTEVVHPDMHTPGGIRRRLLTERRQHLLGLPAKVFARDGSIITALTDARPIEFKGQVAIAYTCATPPRWSRS
jgi:PAS domain-containing protein